ncbi:dihydroxyacetone kinase-like protein [Peptoniphilus koenoeneniae]|uniref:Dihydroxyacetone kinase-like protein n=1 Tax=Peptoniphilus koenoeneniae TaxID=507751 RepID=A0ABU0ASX8_9FIRM|nr:MULTISPECIES: dihydroxyacetone kinase subunit DhaK [Peptoniphilus]ERT60190.1 dihydroxyacetone kinase, DhaK subunit [Peptoniphilus sp. BV3C26]MDQ0274379.1 dihydroxyacetone kinase-like protein [Peptoniphilus koenoeneniae]
MKKIINDPNNVVAETLKGLEYANDKLVYVEELEVIAKKEKSGNVGIVSGGGSGHEPAHAGYVGKGMLDAAVAGNVFSSPSPDRIIEGIRRADSGKGVLLVIKNYSGDIMNFDLAKELAEFEDIDVESVVVRDDVAVEDSTYTAGRRGIAGTIFVHKVAGAAALKGYSLQEVKRIAQKACDNIRTMGMSMSACTIPANGKANFELGENEIEIGMGIHGEPGVEKTNIKTSKEIAEVLLKHIFDDKDFSGKEVALLVNGLGATPLMELYILNKDVREILETKNIKVYKNLVGNYMTALDMSGCSITLMELDDELKEMIDEKCETSALTIN